MNTKLLLYLVTIIRLVHTESKSEDLTTGMLLRGLIDNYQPPTEPQGDRKNGPLSLLTSTRQKPQGDMENKPLSLLTSTRHSTNPPEDDLLESLTQHGISSDSPSSHFLLSLYEKLLQGQHLSQAAGNANTIRSFTNADPPTHTRSRVTMKFHVSGINSGERTQLAELRLTPVDPDQPHHGNQIKRVKVTVRRQGEKVLVRKYKVQESYDNNDGFDILDVTRIIRDIEADLGSLNDTDIEVSVKYKNRKSRSKRSADNNNAILVIYSKDKDFFRKFLAHIEEIKNSKMEHIFDDVETLEEAEGVLAKFLSRERRGAKKNRGRCRKQELIIDFDQIGWGQWIIYPRKFNAYQCSGRCPLPVDDRYAPTNHAVMQSLVRLKDRQAAPSPCCVPISLKPLSMLYYENGEMVVRHHEDMIVDKCGCR